MAELNPKALRAAFFANHDPHAEPSSIELDKLTKAIRTYLDAAAPPPEAVEAMLDRLEGIIRELAGEVAPNGPEDRAWATINDLRAALAAPLGGVGVKALREAYNDVRHNGANEASDVLVERIMRAVRVYLDADGEHRRASE